MNDACESTSPLMLHRRQPVGSTPRAAVDKALPSAATRRRYRRRSLVVLSRMGHCAPSVMQTLLDLEHVPNDWPVRLSAGLPGGIGNTGNECGGLTAPLVMLGLRYGSTAASDGLPLVIEKGHDLCRRFLGCHGTLLCRAIRRESRVPIRCVGVVRRSPELYGEVVSGDTTVALSEDRREAYRNLQAHFRREEFHCAHAVFRALGDIIPVGQDLFDGTAAFIGGTLMQGMTCSALTAGVMAMGMKTGRIEHSRARVIRMIATMAAGGDAFADNVNEFNPTMNAGHRLARWFSGEFGSTQCRAITGCDFASTAGVSRYVDGGDVGRCRLIAERVAEQVRGIVAAGGPATGVV